MRWILIGQLHLDAHFARTWEYVHAVLVIQAKSVPLSILYLFIIILMEFLKYELTTIFSVYVIYQYIFSLDIFISFSEASMLIT